MNPQSIRVAVLGAGSISDYHINGLREAGAQVVALFSRTADKVGQQAQRHGIPFATTRYQDILARDDVDAVVVATPDFTHEEIAIAAIQAGKAVLVQKPMARSGRECSRIIAAASQAGVGLYVSFMHRYFGEVDKVRQLLADEALGNVIMVRQRNATRGANWAAWFYSKEKVGGGVVMQLGIHGIDLLHHLFGSIIAVKAVTAIATPQRTLADGTVVVPDNEDLALCTYRFSSGMMAVHEVSYNEVAGTDRFRMEIYGDHGTAWLRSEHGPLSVNLGQGGWMAPEIPGGNAGWRQHRHFLAMLRGQEPVDTSAQDGLASVLVAEAIYRSAEGGAWETVAT